MEETNMEDADQNNNIESEVAPALIAVHPTQKYVTVSVGSDLRIFNLQEGCVVPLVEDESSGSMHKDSIRAMRYSADGKLFVSAGDDKLVKVWSTDTWHCIGTVSSEKRVSAVSISNDGKFVCFADKFGVVYAVDIEKFDNKQTSNEKAAPILAHYCSIITSLEFSPDGRFIVSADRDFKIRVTVFPKKPLDGAHEIQSFCLGHTEFVSSLAFICDNDSSQGYLVSGSGDSTVRLWDYTCGSLLDTCNVGEQSNGREEEGLPAVTDICPTSDGSLLAVAIQNLSGIMLLNCNISSKKLSIAKVITIPGETFIPTSLGASLSEQLLWMIIGVSSLKPSDSISLTRVRVVSGFSNNNQESLLLEDKEIPGGELLLKTLQGGLCVEEEVFSTAAEALKTAMRNLFTKKQYSVERREFRKRGRNDKKVKK